MLAYCDAWENHTSEDAWATSWWELSQHVGDRIARILGGEAGSVQIQPNASIGLATVASCFDFKKSKRNKVVTRPWIFLDGIHLGWTTRSRRPIEVVSSRDGILVQLDDLLDAIDEETALVAISRTYCSSFRVDAKAIVEHAHSKGALVLWTSINRPASFCSKLLIGMSTF
jgi:kynureninase